MVCSLAPRSASWVPTVCRKLLDLAWHVLGRQRRDHQLPLLVQADRAHVTRRGARQSLLQIGEGLVELVLHLGDGLGRRRCFADQLTELRQARPPLLGGEQVGARVGVAARPRHEHIP